MRKNKQKTSGTNRQVGRCNQNASMTSHVDLLIKSTNY